MEEAGYDWDHRGPKNDKEWAWFLNRHRYFEDLYIAYQATGEARYAEKIFTILEDWLRQHKKAPWGMSFSTAWRPLEAARRVLESWDIVYLKLWNDPLFPESMKPDFLEALTNHGDYLQDHHALYGNHLITEMLALLKLSLILPDAPNASEWQAYALKKMDTEYHEQFYPEGAHKELSSHYQRVVLLNFQKLLTLLEIAKADEALAIWKPRVRGMWQYFAQIQKPDGTAPINNDSDLENVRQLLRQSGQETIKASGETVYFPNAGQVVFRGYDERVPPLWAFFDIGPRGSDHQHEDFLHLSASFGNFNVLVDNGRYTYKPVAWRDYFQGTSSHNILEIEGLEQRPQVNIAKGSLSGTGYWHDKTMHAAWGKAQFTNKLGGLGATWERIVIQLPEHRLLILDQIVSFHPRTAKLYWHGSPGDNWEVKNKTFFIKNGTSIAVLENASTDPSAFELITAEGQTEPLLQGWHSYDFNQKQPAPAGITQLKLSKPLIIVSLLSLENDPDTVEIDSINAKPNEITVQLRRGTGDIHRLILHRANSVSSWFFERTESIH